MILLTRLDRSPVWVNPDQVQWVTRTPDTTITFTNGQMLMVTEPPDDLVAKVVAFRRAALIGLNLLDGPPADRPGSAG